MKMKLFLTFIAALSLLVGLCSGAPDRDPTRFEKDIVAFEKRDAESPPPVGAILAIGSSSMRMWTPRMKKDLEPLTVVPLGFGGSEFSDVIHYFDRLVPQYSPRALLLYEGDNDVANGKSPVRVARDFLRLVDLTHNFDPSIRIYVISVKPSTTRIGVWPIAQKTNRLIEAICEQDSRLNFIDVGPALLDLKGEMIPEYFVEDGVHLNSDGYDQWAMAVRAGILPEERPYESLVGER